MKKFLKQQFVKELAILPVAMIALLGTPENAHADACTDACGTQYEQWVSMCEEYYQGNPAGEEWCLEATDEQYNYCISQC